MPIMHRKAVPPISAANPLPSAFWQAKFRCRAARQNVIQAVDILGLSAIEAAFLRDQNRVSPWSQGRDPLPGVWPAPQYIDPQRQRGSEPECEAGMVGDAVIGERMHQDVKTFAIEHQPRNQGRKLLRREGHLIHRDGMRSDRLVMPASEPSLEALADPRAQATGHLSGLRRVIDMGMIALDTAG